MGATALTVLWYVMGRQGKKWKDIGLRPELADVSRALYLFFIIGIAIFLTEFPVQYGYRAYSGHFLTIKDVCSILGLGVSSPSIALLSIAFACLNPFVEELIVRAYTISEVINLGGSRSLAAILSVVSQASYHLYQGAVNVWAL